MYNNPMHKNSEDNPRLSCQVNVRMTPDMRDQLEETAKKQWTSSSQLARLAVSRELDRQQREVCEPKVSEYLRGDPGGRRP